MFLTPSVSSILMVILLTASVYLCIIFKKPAPLNSWVLTALGNCGERGVGLVIGESYNCHHYSVYVHSTAMNGFKIKLKNETTTPEGSV